VAQVANGGGYLKAALDSDGSGYECQRCWSWFGLFNL
jgi:hypothetical protein